MINLRICIYVVTKLNASLLLQRLRDTVINRAVAECGGEINFSRSRNARILNLYFAHGEKIWLR